MVPRFKSYLDNIYYISFFKNVYLFYLFFKRFYFFFRERGREGEREGGKRRCVRETSICCLLSVPKWGTSSPSRHVSWQRIEPICSTIPNPLSCISQGCLLILDREEGRDRDFRERNLGVREKYQLVASHLHSDPDRTYSLRMCPTGNQTPTFWCTRWHSNQLSHTG